jgi:hypothetical protein
MVGKRTAIKSLTLGAVVPACTVGCSPVSPLAAPGALQQQISPGARADAEDRSQSGHGS